MSQAADILHHMRREPINPMQALMNYGCFRLAARIRDLRDDGHEIHTEVVDMGNDKRVAVYTLIKEAK